jgi:hypothetical protein
MRGVLATFATVWSGPGELLAALPGARLVDAALSVIFVFWLSRFAGRLQKQREAERRSKVVVFPGPGAG